ncbi:MAG: cobalamin biosynthesis protein [Lachnospiraceae bacterium]|nr:cobalamin biosynthesis protein [Lachnospiraceae bacterium]
MKLSIISFTENGIRLSKRIQEFASQLPEVEAVLNYTKWSGAKTSDTQVGQSDPPYVICRIGEWTGNQMEKHHALLFIGACGIAVRAIAPYVDDKLYDSPVLVVDELGNYVIPVLSGHMGGANELAVTLAERIGALPVVTTATDINNKFAVDMFAKKNDLAVMNKEGIAKVSSKVLQGEAIKMSIESYPPKNHVDVVVTSENRAFDADLILKPKIYAIGIGCRRGKESEKIHEFVSKTLEKYEISLQQIFAMASIDKKKDESGLLDWTSKNHVPFMTYSAEELEQIPGEFQSSAFVKSQVGVDNVCERAALKACGADGELLVKKHANDGMTIAIAKRKWSVNIDEE